MIVTKMKALVADVTAFVPAYLTERFYIVIKFFYDLRIEKRVL